MVVSLSIYFNVPSIYLIHTYTCCHLCIFYFRFHLKFLIIFYDIICDLLPAIAQFHYFIFKRGVLSYICMIIVKLSCGFIYDSCLFRHLCFIIVKLWEYKCEFRYKLCVSVYRIINLDIIGQILDVKKALMWVLAYHMQILKLSRNICRLHLSNYIQTLFPPLLV